MTKVARTKTGMTRIRKDLYEILNEAMSNELLMDINAFAVIKAHIDKNRGIVTVKIELSERCRKQINRRIKRK